MLTTETLNSHQIWHFLTRLGEAQILLPAAALTSTALLVRAETRKLAFTWTLLIAVAAAITTATKVAFLGWGLGLATINFTGVSGHTMFAAAIFPVLMLAFVPPESCNGSRIPFLLGVVMAILVGLSRIEVGAHSFSEVLAGWVLGGAVSAVALSVSEATIVFVPPALIVIVMAWLVVMPFRLQASDTHALVARLALAVSGHDKPFKRHDLNGHRNTQSLSSQPPATGNRVGG
jgi:hypothetical protein